MILFFNALVETTLKASTFCKRCKYGLCFGILAHFLSNSDILMQKVSLKIHLMDSALSSIYGLIGQDETVLSRFSRKILTAGLMY